MGRPTHSQVQKQKVANSGDEDVAHQLMSMMHGAHNDESRIISLYGDVAEHTMAQVVMQMIHYANQSNSPIHLLLSTYGGSVDEMFSLYDTIKFIQAPVVTVGLGKVMSAGTLLLASGEKGKRMIGRTSRVMLHALSGGVAGNIFDIQNDVKEMSRLQGQMVDFLVEESTMTKTQVEDIMGKRDHYLTAEQAVKYGIVDVIMSPR